MRQYPVLGMYACTPTVIPANTQLTVINIQRYIFFFNQITGMQINRIRFVVKLIF